ncbi:uncharacterized protein LAJ45_09578 [Morchella importuna]|uniref:Uncharacterized protein n=1 Tax=Morchella conica CCBAS932 TaxID=1392247 RepID=A0A3N4KIW3_9PEZI|nr:uncharacterized protein LAJ45_09578 [Morchella importuna]KAH8146385.1 hypothetical protein LAJ45_09578 [Morchella importuna]RPB08271.1 hypothetical protein P167DRAFT_539350 [Morchella conica CCBAS932]
MFCTRPQQYMFVNGGNANTGSFLQASQSPVQTTLKRRRRSGSNAEEPSHTESQPQIPIADARSTIKRPRRDLQPAFQLSFVTPQYSQNSCGTYQPSPPTGDSESDSSTDRFAAHFDEDVVMDGQHEQQKQQNAMPSVVTSPPTEVMGRLEVSGDVDMDQTVVKKKATGFRMGFRGDCEKCRLRVPGHYSHY